MCAAVFFCLNFRFLGMCYIFLVMKPRYLTKSRFKLASECPTKLYYIGKKNVYADQTFDDQFLKSLARGGFQVGELAKRYFPGGIDIDVLDYDLAIGRTDELMGDENVTIYESAIKYSDFFIRVDILKKTGKRVELYEVKAKSFEGGKGLDNFTNKDGSINSKWESYLLDIAFQKFVTMRALHGCEVSAFLMLTDKDTICDVDGLNQMFHVKKDADGRERTLVSERLGPEHLATPILTAVNVDELCARIYESFGGLDGFEKHATGLAEKYKADERITPVPSKACKECQFKATEEDLANGLRSGFTECWRTAFDLSEEQLKQPTIFDLWDARGIESLLSEGKRFLHEIEESDLKVKDDDAPGISRTKRQLMQVLKQGEMVVSSEVPAAYLDKAGMRSEMENWSFPLHFIDFETTSVAIPFYAGQRPYDHIAFQFSHHLVNEDGSVEHRSQFLCSDPGRFPNFEFVRALRTSLGDKGTIFRYADHENIYLNHIFKQLRESTERDRDELCEFIKTISKSSKSSAETWRGSREMVDLRKLVLRYYYDHHTGGSNSIKDVLPAVLNSSAYIKEKYSKPIYGAPGGVKSLNFKDKVWVEFEGTKVKSPYKLLPGIFDDVAPQKLELLTDSDELNDGGAAMMAYARLQFEEMSEMEREKTNAALLKYCELDTFAMVLIYEAWREMLK